MRRLVMGAMMLSCLLGMAGNGANGVANEPRLQFERGDRVFVMDEDGTRQRRSILPGYGLWSHDGGRVTYVAKDRGQPWLYLANGDGGARKKIAKLYLGGDCVDADWSPRGKRLAFTTDCDIDFRELFVVRRDGKAKRRLAARFWTLGPTWAPDGKTLLFGGSPPTHRGQFAFQLVPLAAKKPRRIPGLWFDFYYAVDWAWSKDGLRVLALIDTSDSNRGLELSTIGRGGGSLHQLTPSELNVGSFELSPDGESIVLQAAPGTRDWEVYVMHADGTGLQQLTDNRAQDTDPHWSPDGQRLVFTSMRDGNMEIYVMAADGSGQTNLTQNPAADHHASWIPGG